MRRALRYRQSFPQPAPKARPKQKKPPDTQHTSLYQRQTQTAATKHTAHALLYCTAAFHIAHAHTSRKGKAWSTHPNPAYVMLPVVRVEQLLQPGLQVRGRHRTARDHVSLLDARGERGAACHGSGGARVSHDIGHLFAVVGAKREFHVTRGPKKCQTREQHLVGQFTGKNTKSSMFLKIISILQIWIHEERT